MRDFRDLPKWRKALINAKWTFIKTNRKMHGQLPMMIFLIVFLVIFILAGQLEKQNTQWAFEPCKSVRDYNI